MDSAIKFLYWSGLNRIKAGVRDMEKYVDVMEGNYAVI